ncbi:hypothetical protein K438DRAFT_1937043 [Mycena galopus ATCC 62051]|nr:hypothetical protein K438DRAFT_1937043 [Mycena galopus ATCC 62051]
MTLMSLTLMSYVQALAVLAILLFYPLPSLIERHYPDTAPIAAAMVWTRDVAEAGLAALTFTLGFVILLECMFIALEWLTRGWRAAPGPIALEAGAAPTPAPSAAHATDTTPHPAWSDPPSLATKLTIILSSCICIFTYLIFSKGIASPDRSVRENLGTVYRYIMSGTQVLNNAFVGVMVVFLLRRCCRCAAVRIRARVNHGDAAPTSTPAEVLRDDGVKEGEKVSS